MMCARPSFSFCGDRSAAAAFNSFSSSGAAVAASLACCRSLAELGGFFWDAVAIGASFLDGFAIGARRAAPACANGVPLAPQACKMNCEPEAFAGVLDCVKLS